MMSRQSQYASKVRKELILLLGGICNTCGLDDVGLLKLDHVKPLGYSIDTISCGSRPRHWREQLVNHNLQVLCTLCNKKKGDRVELTGLQNWSDPESFRKWRSEELEPF